MKPSEWDENFKKIFGCTPTEYSAAHRAKLIGALRGENKCTGNDRAAVGKTIFDLVLRHPHLCDAILFEMEREEMEKDHALVRMRAQLWNTKRWSA